MGIGEIAALTTAFLWTISSFVWGRVKLTAFELNICKNLVATILLGLHIAVMLGLNIFISPSETAGNDGQGQVAAVAANDSTKAPSEVSPSESKMFRLAASPEAWFWLSLSGIIGIVVGDTCFFRSLQILGPRRSLVVATTSPIFAVTMGWLLLDEYLEIYKLFGILLTVAGISIVVGEKKGQIEALDLYPGPQSTGIGLGLCAAGCQAIGLAFSKMGMEIDNCSPLEATFIRILFAALCSFAVLVGRKKVAEFFKRVLKFDTLKNVFLAASLGTWLGIWLSQVAVQKTDIGIAQTLLSTSPLFAIPIVFFVQGHRTSAFAIGGTLIALCGIATIVW